MDRLDGNAIWHGLTWADKNVIGGIALELAAAWIGIDYENQHWDERGNTPHARALDAAVQCMILMLQKHVADVLSEKLDPEIFALMKPMPVPSLLGRICRRCGCSEHDACHTAAGPCSWAEPDLCSACTAICLPPPKEAP